MKRPANAWSKENMASIFGSAGLVAGGALIKPKDILKPSVKNAVGNGKKRLKHDSEGGIGGLQRRLKGLFK